MSTKKYIIDRSYEASKGIAIAVLACLGVGLLFQTIGKLFDVAWLLQIGSLSKSLFIPALGIGIAMMLRSNSMVTICAGISAGIGGNSIIALNNGNLGIAGGEPIGAIIAALVCIWIGKKVAGKSKFDMIITPALCLLAGGLVGQLSSKVITPILAVLSSTIELMTNTSPIISSAIIAVIFTFLILSPASSAALAIALHLDPISSAAALIGCSIPFTTFAFLGIKENTIGAFWGQLICTPKLQTPNIIKHPHIILPSLLLSAILSPIGTSLLGITSVNEVAGLGLCALVAPLYMYANQGVTMLLYFSLITIVIPAVVSLLLRPFLFNKKLLSREIIRIDID